MRQDSGELCRLFRRETAEQSAPLRGDMRGRIAVNLKDVMIEESLPHVPLWTRQVRDGNHPVEQAVERRDDRPARSVPPIVDQDVERFQRSNRVPPHVGNEYGVTGFEFGDLGRRGCLLEARVARKVGIVGIDQADRYALWGEFEGPD